MRISRVRSQIERSAKENEHEMRPHAAPHTYLLVGIFCIPLICSRAELGEKSKAVVRARRFF